MLLIAGACFVVDVDDDVVVVAIDVDDLVCDEIGVAALNADNSKDDDNDDDDDACGA